MIFLDIPYVTLILQEKVQPAKEIFMRLLTGPVEQKLLLFFIFRIMSML